MRPIAATLLALALLFSTCSPTFADTLAAKRAQAAQVEAQVAQLNNKAELATEAYDAATSKYQALTVKVDALRARIAALQSRTDTLQTALDTRADDMYRNNDAMDVIAALLSAHSLQDLQTDIEMLTRLSEQDASTVDQLKEAKAEASKARDALQVTQASARTEQLARAASAKTVRAQLAAQTTLLAGINSQIKNLIAQQQAAAAEAARARYDAWLSSRTPAAPASDIGGGDPPTSSKGAAAVYWAKTALGRPYQWGAAGPDSFDCSGLCMWAYAHVGISLPHYSGAQYDSGPHVALSNLEPGDLVFFGNPIHHVGMYIGGGEFIEAPYTGADVRISELAGRMGDYAGATRPQ